MAIQWMDNFSTYGTGTTGTTNMSDGLPYASFASGLGVSGSYPTVDPDGISSGNVMYTGTGFRLACPTPDDVMGEAHRVWFEYLPNINGERSAIFDFRTPANGYGYRVIVEPNGALSVYRSSNTNPGVPGDAACLATTVVPALFLGAWIHYEFKVNTGTGEFELRREGALLLSGTDPSPLGGTIGNMAWSGRGVSTTGFTPFRIKDLIVWDGSGSQNNDFVGACGVYRLPVDGDVSSGWSRSSGASDYDLLDEAPPADSGYIFAGEGPFPAPSIMTFADLPPEIVGVRALMMLGRMWKTDGGDANVQMSLISAGDEDNGADRPISTTPTYWFDISELSPDTGQAWNPLEVNAAQVKLDRTV